MNNVSFSQMIKQSNTDEWYTPIEAVNIIIPYLKKKGYKKILCPFDLPESNFVILLNKAGFDVTYSHIDTGIDFFDITNFNDYDAVISNPPFSKKQKIFTRLFDVNIPFAMVIGWNGLFDNHSRWELFKNNDFELLIPKGRIHFFSNDCAGKSPQFQSVYVCHNILDKQIEFCDMPKGGF